MLEVHILGTVDCDKIDGELAHRNLLKNEKQTLKVSEQCTYPHHFGYELYQNNPELAGHYLNIACGPKVASSVCQKAVSRSSIVGSLAWECKHRWIVVGVQA